MKNELSNNPAIISDGVCVYFTANSSNPVLGKVLLLIADSAICIVLVFSIFENIGGLILASLLLVLFFGHYTLWNLLGRENLIINTKTISYQHDFGLYKSAYTTKKINKLLEILIVNKLPEKEQNDLQLRFFSYNDADIRVELYTTVFHISSTDAEKLNKMVNNLFIDKVTESYTLPPINLN